MRPAASTSRSRLRPYIFLTPSSRTPSTPTLASPPPTPAVPGPVPRPVPLPGRGPRRPAAVRFDTYAQNPRKKRASAVRGGHRRATGAGYESEGRRFESCRARYRTFPGAEIRNQRLPTKPKCVASLGYWALVRSKGAHKVSVGGNDGLGVRTSVGPAEKPAYCVRRPVVRGAIHREGGP